MFDTYFDIHALIFDSNRIPVALIALLIVTFSGLAIGPVGGDANPLFWRVISGLLGGLGKRMDKPGRKRGDLILRGFVITVSGLLIGYGFGQFFNVLALSFPLWRIGEIIALIFILSSGALWIVLIKLYRAMNSHSVGEGAYFALARTARQDFSGTDDFTMTRSGMAQVVRSFDKAIVAPLFWYLILGLPGAYIYSGLAALNWRFGREGHTSGFGVMTGALEKLMGIVPHVLSSLLLTLACVFTPTAMMSRAMKAWNAHKNAAPYAEGGLPVNVLSWGLNVSLGGPLQDLDGRTVKRVWAGPDGATAKLEAKHLHRAVYAVFIATLLFVMTLIGAMVAAGLIQA